MTNKNIPSFVSIIIPIYNAELYLRKCLDSVVSQTYSNLEIILINDGSTDSSPEIIDEYATRDNRIIAINKQNGGIGSAYKAAFEEMTGDYVLFVDSDDWLEVDALESLLQFANQNDADIVYFGSRAFDIEGEEVIIQNLNTLDDVVTENKLILTNQFEIIKHPSLVRLFRGTLFQNVEIFEQNIGIDEMLIPQLLVKCKRACYTSTCYYNLLIRKTSVSREAYDNIKILQTIKVYNFVIDFISANISTYSQLYLNRYLDILFSFYILSIKKELKISKEVSKLIRSEFKKMYLVIKAKFNFNQSKRVRLYIHLLNKTSFLFIVHNYIFSFLYILGGVTNLKSRSLDD